MRPKEVVFLKEENTTDLITNYKGWLKLMKVGGLQKDKFGNIGQLY